MGAISGQKNYMVDLEEIAKNDVFKIEVKTKDGKKRCLRVRVEDIEYIQIEGLNDEPTEEDMIKLRAEAIATYGKDK